MASSSMVMASASVYTGASNDSAVASLREEVEEMNESPAAASATVEGSDGSPPTDAAFDAELARLGPLAEEFLVSEGITDVASFLSRTAIGLAPALSVFMLRAKQKQRAVRTTQGWIGRWRRDVLQRRETLKEGLNDLHPTFEIFNGEVRSLFASKSIVDPRGLLQCSGLASEWMAWRQDNNLAAANANTANNAVSDWRQSVKEQVSAGTVTASNANALDFDELTLLGPLPREFLVSQGIADVESFLSCSVKGLSPALSKLLERKGQKKLSPRTAGKLMYRWKRNLLQRRETLKEEGLEGLHRTFEVFDGEVRSFFASKSIVDPHDLLQFTDLGCLWMDWRQDNHLSAANANTANGVASDWRQSVKEQVAEEATNKANALNFDELTLLGPVARKFLVSQGIVDVQGFLSYSAKSLAPALSKFLEHNTDTKRSIHTTEKWIARWRQGLRQRRKTLKEGLQGLHPTLEIFNGEVRSFFASKSIVDPHGLLHYTDLASEWLAWRQDNNLAAVNTQRATVVASEWRQSVEEQVADEANALNFDELTRLGPVARKFLVSQGIVDVQGFLFSSAKDLAPALSTFMERTKQKQRSAETMKKWIGRWKRNLRQRRETLKEEGREGLHPTFEIFDGEVRSFLASKSIANPKDLLEYRTLGHDWATWRVNNSLTAVLNEHSAGRTVSEWRKSVKEQLERKRLRRTAVKRTYPWLSVGVSAESAAAASPLQDCTDVSPSAAVDGSDTGGTDLDDSSDTSGRAQKRARLEESVAQAAPGLVAAGAIDSDEALADSEHE